MRPAFKKKKKLTTNHYRILNTFYQWPSHVPSNKWDCCYHACSCKVLRFRSLKKKKKKKKIPLELGKKKKNGSGNVRGQNRTHPDPWPIATGHRIWFLRDFCGLECESVGNKGNNLRSRFLYLVAQTLNLIEWFESYNERS